MPGVDISQKRRYGESSYRCMFAVLESRHVLVLIDGVPMARAGIGTARLILVRFRYRWRNVLNIYSRAVQLCTRIWVRSVGETSVR